jgi:hypothetical protein
MPDHKQNDANWKLIYQVGAWAAFAAVLVALVEMGITFLPGGNSIQETVWDWFDLYTRNPFMGMRNLGLLNILFNFVAAPIYLALYGAHRSTYHSAAALAALIAFVGVATFLATNRAFAMLDLSLRYAAAATEAERAVLAAAGQAMLSVGHSHTPGTFLAFFLAETAGITISVVMLRGGVFSKTNAILGILAFGGLLVYEILASFAPSLGAAPLMLAMFAGLLGMAWYILTGRRLLQLAAKWTNNTKGV